MTLGNRHAQHSFVQIPDVNIQRSSFDRSYATKDTFNFDYLVPIMVQEVIPGDTHNVNLNTFARLATPIVPIMDNMYVDYFFFFVPNRLIYDKWEKLNGAQDNPGDSIDYVMPILTLGAAFTVDSIFDHMGLPTGVANVPVLNTLPLRAYIKIYNDWFRDENLQNSLTLPTGVGPDTQAMFAMQKRGKKKDYFTGALPWPQKGTALSLPLGGTATVKGTAPVMGIGVTGGTGTDNTGSFVDATGVTQTMGGTTKRRINITSFPTGLNALVTPPTAATVVAGASWPDIKADASQTLSTMYADLTTATAATINQFRQAIMLQGLLELDARGGTRYVEILRSHFKVVSPDFRLQRAEYLGGGTSSITCHPVAQTSPTSGANAQGALAAFGTHSVAGSKIGFAKSFVEHGYIIGLACARADLTYQQGLERLWSKSTRYDFFWPKLQELGEQTVLNQEIYCQGAAADTSVFGYQERYSEYRYQPSQIKGQFRSTYATPLDMWHMSEKFASLPALNSTFIVQNTPITRAIAVTTSPHLLMDIWFRYQCARPMVTHSVPATLGRF